MAHLVEQMAYVGATPWHGLGSHLSPKQPLEIWQREAGMDWLIQESPVHFKADAIGHLGSIHTFPEQKVLYRSDTKAPLSVVSNRYQVVQPREVLEFYRDLTEVSGYELETAGVLKGGRKFWALARTGQGTALKGNDQVNGYPGGTPTLPTSHFRRPSRLPAAGVASSRQVHPPKPRHADLLRGHHGAQRAEPRRRLAGSQTTGGNPASRRL